MQTTDQLTMLADRRRAATDRLDTLRRNRNKSVLGGGDFDHVEIARTEAELEAIDAAEAEAVRRQREADYDARKAHLERLKDQLRVAEESRLSHIAEAEQAARDFAGAVTNILADVASIQNLYRQITGRSPYAIDATDTADTLANYLMAILIPAAARLPSPRLFGRRLELHEAPFITAKTDWTAAERKRGADVLEPALTQEI